MCENIKSANLLLQNLENIVHNFIGVSFSLPFVLVFLFIYCLWLYFFYFASCETRQTLKYKLICNLSCCFIFCTQPDVSNWKGNYTSLAIHTSVHINWVLKCIGMLMHFTFIVIAV